MKKAIVKTTAIFISLMLLCSYISYIPVFSLTDYNAVYFGSYPQTKITDSSLISTLNSMVSDEDWISFGYYNNGTKDDYAFYTDKYYAGQKYRGIYFTAYRPNQCSLPAGESPSIPYGQYNYSKNTCYWFLYEPIAWRVLDESTGLLFSEYALDAEEFKADNSSKVYDSSDIKTWLENEFTKTAFPDDEKDLITNQITLLTTDQLNNLSYFSDGNDKIALPTEYAMCNNSYALTISGTGMPYSGIPRTDWWIKPDESDLSSNNMVGIMGVQALTYADKICGVRPALNTDLIKTIPSDSTQHTIYYTLYNPDGSVYSTHSERYNTGSPITAYTPEMEGTFSGWNDTVPSVMPDHDLYYCSTVQIQYTITYVLCNGEDDIVNSYTAGETIIKPADPVREHYSFKGWNTAVPETMPAANTTITAIWEINKHDVIYIVDSQAYERIPNIAYGTAVPECTKANPEKEGYRFTGWPVPLATMPDEDLYIDACFDIESFTITYNLNNGEDNIVIEYIFSEGITDIPVPERTGYIFDGWSPEIPATMPANNLTVKAKWKIAPETHTHNFVYETTETHHWLVCACGEKKASEKHSFTWKTEKEPTATKQGLTKGICSKCGYCITKAVPPLGNSVINAPASRKIAYRSNIKVTATGENIPTNCRLVLFAEDKPVWYGDNSKVEYKAEDIRDNITFTVKIMGKIDNKVRNDSNGKPLVKSFDVTLNKGFFQRIIAFFVHLFKLTQTEKFEPAA